MTNPLTASILLPFLLFAATQAACGRSERTATLVSNPDTPPDKKPGGKTGNVVKPGQTPTAVPTPPPGTRFLLAAETGNLTEIKALLASGVPVDTADAAGNPAVLLASWQGHAAVATYLCSAKSKHKLCTLPAPTDDLTRQLAAALRQPDVDDAAVEALLQAGADVNGALADGSPALGQFALASAVIANRGSTLDLLLSYGAHVNRQNTAVTDPANEGGFTALRSALRRHDVTAARSLLKAGANPILGVGPSSDFEYALALPYDDLPDMLLTGMWPRHRQTTFSELFTRADMLRNRQVLLESFLALKVNPDQLSQGGKLPLVEATTHGLNSVVTSLLAAKASPVTRDVRKISALHQAILTDNAELLWLLDTGALARPWPALFTFALGNGRLALAETMLQQKGAALGPTAPLRLLAAKKAFVARPGHFTGSVVHAGNRLILVAKRPEPLAIRQVGLAELENFEFNSPPLLTRTAFAQASQGRLTDGFNPQNIMAHAAGGKVYVAFEAPLDYTMNLSYVFEYDPVANKVRLMLVSENDQHAADLQAVFVHQDQLILAVGTKTQEPLTDSSYQIQIGAKLYRKPLSGATLTPAPLTLGREVAGFGTVGSRLIARLEPRPRTLVTTEALPPQIAYVDNGVLTPFATSKSTDEWITFHDDTEYTAYGGRILYRFPFGAERDPTFAPSTADSLQSVIPTPVFLDDVIVILRQTLTSVGDDDTHVQILFTTPPSAAP